MTQRTLVLLKPDTVRRGLVGEVLGRFEAKGLTIVAMEHRTIDAATGRPALRRARRARLLPAAARVRDQRSAGGTGARGRRGDRGGARDQRRHRRPQGGARHHPRRPVAVQPREPRARLGLAPSPPSARWGSGSPTCEVRPVSSARTRRTAGWSLRSQRCCCSPAAPRPVRAGLAGGAVADARREHVPPSAAATSSGAAHPAPGRRRLPGRRPYDQVRGPAPAYAPHRLRDYRADRTLCSAYWMGRSARRLRAAVAGRRRAHGVRRGLPQAAGASPTRPARSRCSTCGPVGRPASRRSSRPPSTGRRRPSAATAAGCS